MTRKYLAFSLLATIVVLFLVSTVGATAQSFTVQAGQEKTIYLSLAVDDHVQILFTVTGQASNALDFHITDSQENIMKNFGTTDNVNYAFVCLQEGEYKLHFSNVVSAGDKLVSLAYEVQHYVFGIEQNLFMTLIIVGLCIAMVAVFILMSKRP